jgi:CBS domain-containing protein
MADQDIGSLVVLKSGKLVGMLTFREVIEACAETREEGRWITPDFVDAYCTLHEMGWAHSVECRDGAILFLRASNGQTEIIAGFSLIQVNHWGVSDAFSHEST